MPTKQKTIKMQALGNNFWQNQSHHLPRPAGGEGGASKSNNNCAKFEQDCYNFCMERLIRAEVSVPVVSYIPQMFCICFEFYHCTASLCISFHKLLPCLFIYFLIAGISCMPLHKSSLFSCDSCMQLHELHTELWVLPKSARVHSRPLDECSVSDAWMTFNWCYFCCWWCFHYAAGVEVWTFCFGTATFFLCLPSKRKKIK